MRRNSSERMACGRASLVGKHYSGAEQNAADFFFLRNTSHYFHQSLSSKHRAILLYLKFHRSVVNIVELLACHQNNDKMYTQLTN